MADEKQVMEAKLKIEFEFWKTDRNKKTNLPSKSSNDRAFLTASKLSSKLTPEVLTNFEPETKPLNRRILGVR